MSHTVEILMAVYNNADYIAAQLQSLFNQSYPYFRVIIRDDCSSDQSVQLIENFMLQYPNKIHLIKGTENLGARGNFAALLNEAKADYIMFCDADDVWMPTKIEESLALMQKSEEIYGEKTPLLIHTDLKVVDQNLCSLSHSFWNYSKIDPESARFLNRLLVQNAVTGCTMLVNKPLMELAAPIPNEAIMHDWWIALVASAFGHIEFLAKPTMLYRQHGKNSIGAKNGRGLTAYWNFAKKAMNFKGREGLRQSLWKTMHQASQFLRRYGSSLNSEKYLIVQNYAALASVTAIKKRYLFFRHRFFKSSFAKNLGMFLLL